MNKELTDYRQLLWDDFKVLRLNEEKYLLTLWSASEHRSAQLKNYLNTHEFTFELAFKTEAKLYCIKLEFSKGLPGFGLSGELNGLNYMPLHMLNKGKIKWLSTAYTKDNRIIYDPFLLPLNGG